MPCRCGEDQNDWLWVAVFVLSMGLLQHGKKAFDYVADGADRGTLEVGL